ncbi:MAG: 50S ribosomal protein L16 [Pseudomonadota bacterium]|nr:50S ribosomal protein L16 [Pseudomonadota bacterium]
MFQPPNQLKYRKEHKGRNRGYIANPGVHFGDFAMMSVGRNRLNARQIESARRAITHSLKRTGKLWIRVFPQKPITQKPLEVRQGKGKGNVEYYAYEVKPGTVVFELAGVSEEQAVRAFKLAEAKLPFKTKLIKRWKAEDES